MPREEQTPYPVVVGGHVTAAPPHLVSQRLSHRVPKIFTSRCDCSWGSYLWQLRQEKVDLENQLEREQEYVVNKLRKQLAQVR